MRGGAAVGIPLTLLQLAVHSRTGAHVDPLLIANNFALGSAIYGADRLTSEPWARDRLPSRLCALASTAFLASDPHTVGIAWLVPPLHTSYAQLKRVVAPVKPFLVAALWTVAIYYLPVWRSGGGAIDGAQCAAFGLSLAALSHALDVGDRDEDNAAGLATPAVAMGTDAPGYAIGLALGAALLDVAASARPVPLYDTLALVAAGGLVGARADVAVAVAAAFTLAYARAHDLEVLTAVLSSSEATHRAAIASTLRAVDVAGSLAEPWRNLLLDVTFGAARSGDAFGRVLLDALEYAARHETWH